jgi:hypothetical protein
VKICCILYRIGRRLPAMLIHKVSSGREGFARGLALTASREGVDRSQEDPLCFRLQDVGGGVLNRIGLRREVCIF